MTESNSHPEADVYTTRYDVDDLDSLCFTLVRAVSAVTGDPPEAVEPLYSAIDPEALETVMESLRRGDTASTATVEFTLHDCRVSVRPTGAIELRTFPDGTD